MIEIASKIVLCLVIAAILGFIIGFLIGKATRKQQYASVPEKSSKNVGNIYNKPLILAVQDQLVKMI